MGQTVTVNGAVDASAKDREPSWGWLERAIELWMGPRRKMLWKWRVEVRLEKSAEHAAVVMTSRGRTAATSFASWGPSEAMGPAILAGIMAAVEVRLDRVLLQLTAGPRGGNP
ncbi:MAG: hypothetical protein AB7W06_17355 [Alphaproteobacteria bacterium]